MAETGGLTPEFVREKAQSKYFSLLKSWLKQEESFPLRLRGCTISNAVPFAQRMKLINGLSKKQKTEKAAGYQMVLETRSTRSEGTQTFLKAIEFPTFEDYLGFLGKSKEFSSFQNSVDRIRRELPELEEWLVENPRKILKYLENWEMLIEVVRFFRDEEPTTAALRALPIPVPTKFMELRQPILRELLDKVIPEDRINKEEQDIALRYGLDKDEDFRFRIIIPESLNPDFTFRDFAVLPSELGDWDPPFSNVLIIENKYSFLGIDLPKDWLKMWGMGKAVVRLNACKWLEQKNLYYWGDIDPQGFEILHFLRTFFPHTRSVCMEREDYDHFREYAHSAGTFYARDDFNLTSAEQECYHYLVENQQYSRIEQERIENEWVYKKLSSFNKHL
ncbi:MAG: hypothetical protein JEY99_07250 [Spirochaetales bacterium]|nr:hypothetical protein [Spirochaetales bacterium]